MSSINGLMSAPCFVPTPSSINFDIFCQFNYHSKPYICDPSGALSRTEIEMLDNFIDPLNFTSCFCNEDHCSSSKPHLFIVIVPSTSIESLCICDPSMEFTRPHTLAIAAKIYAEELAYQWTEGCRADLMLVFIRSFDFGELKKPYLVPLYRYNFEYLSKFSEPVKIRKSQSVYSAISGYLENVPRIIDQRPLEKVSSMPLWALFVCCAFIILATIALYIGNYITQQVDNAHWYQSKSPVSKITIRLANDRWRAGFGGGMIMQNSASSAKSSVMFKQFNQRTRLAQNLQKI
ncbi:unnamed protein product [Dracunculus medinensis]|uniref:MSC domain-containing protein n=1 Tax=Dracunculus medinensis TaxID=318479 RepID=A0A0N4UFC8_DRAME|nr:unnamed protein product [Dracunculus medinensis]